VLIESNPIDGWQLLLDGKTITRKILNEIIFLH
jgi:hypothetical protein